MGGVFLANLEVMDLTGQNSKSDRPFVELLTNFGYQPADFRKSAIWVPRGFRCDAASVPRLAWFLFPPWGRCNRAAILHDWLYWAQLCSRLQADEIFREALAACGVPAWRRSVMFNAVRIGGAEYWNKRKPEEIQSARDLARLNGGTIGEIE